jgi:hypothetical protein
MPRKTSALTVKEIDALRWDGSDRKLTDGRTPGLQLFFEELGEPPIAACTPKTGNRNRASTCRTPDRKDRPGCQLRWLQEDPQADGREDQLSVEPAGFHAKTSRRRA